MKDPDYFLLGIKETPSEDNLESLDLSEQLSNLDFTIERSSKEEILHTRNSIFKKIKNTKFDNF